LDIILLQLENTKLSIINQPSQIHYIHSWTSAAQLPTSYLTYQTAKKHQKMTQESLEEGGKKKTPTAPQHFRIQSKLTGRHNLHPDSFVDVLTATHPSIISRIYPQQLLSSVLQHSMLISGPVSFINLTQPHGSHSRMLDLRSSWTHLQLSKPTLNPGLSSPLSSQLRFLESLTNPQQACAAESQAH
jgi:hypothetical protein